jgi:hypothetical protein
VEALPLVALPPLQPSEAVQEVAFVELQVRVAALPFVRLVGFALRFTTGATAVPEVTVTDVEALLLPPAPVQDSVKFAVAVSAPVDLLPLVDTVPLQAPDATHDVAFVELQLMVEEPPEPMLVGDAFNETVGAAVALDPPPPQDPSAKAAPMVRPAVITRVKHTCQYDAFMAVSLAISPGINGKAMSSHLKNFLSQVAFKLTISVEGELRRGVDLPEILSVVRCVRCSLGFLNGTANTFNGELRHDQ